MRYLKVHWNQSYLMGILTNFNETEKVPKYEMVFSLVKLYLKNIT